MKIELKLGSCVSFVRLGNKYVTEIDYKNKQICLNGMLKVGFEEINTNPTIEHINQYSIVGYDEVKDCIKKVDLVIDIGAELISKTAIGVPVSKTLNSIEKDRLYFTNYNNFNFYIGLNELNLLITGGYESINGYPVEIINLIKVKEI